MRLREDRAVAGISLILAAIAALWMIQQWGGYGPTLVMANLVSLIPPFIAAAFCIGRARMESGKVAIGWFALAASAAAWGLGQTAWTYHELWTLREIAANQRIVPFPFWSDLGYLLSPFLLMVGLLYVPKGIFRDAQRQRMIADSTIVAGALFLVLWLVFLRPIITSYDAPLWHVTTALAYPMTDLLVVALAIWATMFSGGAERSRMVWIWAGAFCLVIGDVLFAVVVFEEANIIPWFNVLWPLAFMFIGQAAIEKTDDQWHANWLVPVSKAAPWICVSGAIVAWIMLKPLGIIGWSTVAITAAALVWSLANHLIERRKIGQVTKPT